MTEGKRGNGTELGKRFYDMFSRNDRERSSGNINGIDLLSELTATGGVTHEEALLLLAAPEDIEELIRKKEASGKDQSSLQRLLLRSDEKRRLKVLIRADDVGQVTSGMKKGAQGIGLLRGEAILYNNTRLYEIYCDWLKSEEEIERQHYRLRLISLWTEEWVAVLQAVGESQCAVSLAWDIAIACRPEIRHDLQDIQLESLYRALARCHEAGLDSRLELLALWPADTADFIAAHDFIEEVGKQTLCHVKPSVVPKIGALLHPKIAPVDAADIARLADVIVVDTEKQSELHRFDEEGSFRATDSFKMDEPITDWASPVLLGSNLEEILLRIRRVKPHMVIRVSGEVTVSDLRRVYRLGISEVCCALDLVAAVRIAGIRLEWMLSRLPTAEEA